jgi:sec-independent protein translocase protein TatA
MLTFAYMGSQEWLIIAGLAVLLFGGTKLPQLAKGLGEGIREFKKSIHGDDEPTPPAPQAAPAPEPSTENTKGA